MSRADYEARGISLADMRQDEAPTGAPYVCGCCGREFDEWAESHGARFTTSAGVAMDGECGPIECAACGESPCGNAAPCCGAPCSVSCACPVQPDARDWPDRDGAL